MKDVNASIITIGDELLIGQTIDTNSAFISQELNKIGIWVKKRIAVGDDWKEIWKTLDQERRHNSVIIITGGLGPTADDITKPLLSEYFGTKLVVNEKVLEHIQFLFDQVYRRSGPLLERNRKQAEVPESCEVLMNQRGTAPGMLFNIAPPEDSDLQDKQVVISLPGVPNEMKGLMETEVIPRLKNSFDLPIILHQTLLTAGVGESILADKIQHWEEALPSHMKLAYLPHFGMVRMRITATGTERINLQSELEGYFRELKELVKEWLVIDEDLTISQAIAKLLQERKETVGTTESCTGGFIAHLLSREPGSSNHFLGSVVSYANEVKENVLHVSKETLQTHGAVSEQVVIQMAKGGLQELKTDYIIATTGIMGPDGGTDKKPVGMVWVAVGNKDRIVAKEFHFRFDRARNIEQTASTALNLLRKFILKQ